MPTLQCVNSTMEFNNLHFMVDPHGVGDIAVYMLPLFSHCHYQSHSQAVNVRLYLKFVYFVMHNL